MSKLISYAQNFEDVILWRVLGHIKGGRYIDVGAQSPDIDSVSLAFYERGWRGIHVEPTQHYSDLLRARRPDEQVLQVAVTDAPGELRFFDVADTGLSTLDEQIAQEHRDAGFNVSEVRVPAVTLDSVFEMAGPGEIHWLKIDVEGAEREVIAGWNGSRRPWVLVIEGTRPQSPELNHHQWDPTVLAKGYSYVYFDGLNRFYVSDAHPELAAVLTCGPNVFDDFVLAPQSAFCSAANAVAAEAMAQQRASAAEAAQQQREAAAEVEGQQRAQLAEASRKIELLEVELQARRASEAAFQREKNLIVEAAGEYREEFQRAVAQNQVFAVEIGRRDAEIVRLNEVVHALLTSTSWRITRPLRGLKYLVTQPTMFARRVVLAAMRRVAQRPAVARPLNTLLKRVPRLHAKLISVAVNNRIIAQVPGAMQHAGLVGGVGSFEGLTEVQALEQLSMRGQALYTDIAVANRRERR
ncbi:TPA: FkbM family methyltransferase [Stenotrophomonas maltophilia]|jgi:FkbM family methyltransferase|uniref:FkbM family methyltransferase n=1 Tax=Stenotrophomonas maltophilia TaxID=40324 RepID=UPI000C144CBE|nr:FkbM family methyltransferase [Stenotrophomonas maltophilia]MBN4991244.1 FkbM family methyltransferase [Stenotrophomonas maltophilia]MCI1130456.1 FkbM family methyltransferase [Stenotrophomonas maltophilia]MCI1149147.1 FkbM family methyltransferase [Stenotrophomonas maltophilia]HEL3158217.1 FkbM family methyltransferase [Stenotrophomonas maltophilia]HEL3818789.1 FkbM family methyltransferase [Stenotrophomonas maltophilia]